MVAQLHGTMIKMENFQKLHELKKDLIGIDNLVIPGRVGTRCWVVSESKGWKAKLAAVCASSHSLSSGS